MISFTMKSMLEKILRFIIIKWAVMILFMYLIVFVILEKKLKMLNLFD